jgi:hypothetical protein
VRATKVNSSVDKIQDTNGERKVECRTRERAENGERRKIGEWRTENGEWRTENGEWRMENGEWRTENGEWRMIGERRKIGEGRTGNGDSVENAE